MCCGCLWRLKGAYMKAIYKNFFRGLLNNKGKFISVFFIILLGAAFFSGLRSSERDMLLSAEEYYDGSSLMDFRVMGTLGLTDEDVDQISALSSVELAEGGYSADLLCGAEELNTAAKVMSISENINIPTVTEGRMPENAGECLMDSFLSEKVTYGIGDIITFSTGGEGDLSDTLSVVSMEIVGYANLPQYMDLNRGSGTVGNGEIDGFILALPSAFSLPAYTQIDISLSGAKALESFGDEYDDLATSAGDDLEKLGESAAQRRHDEVLDSAIREQLTAMGYGSIANLPADQLEALLKQFLGEETFNALKAGIEQNIPASEWYVLGRDTIISAVNFQNDASRVASLGKLLPIIFFLVAALVSLTAITRLVEEERMQIGTLKALGSGNGSIMARYLSYALLPTLTGSVIGVLFGEKVFPLAIIKAYTLLYAGLNAVVIPYNLVEGLIAVLASVLCTVVATVFAAYNISRAKPAQIMRPEAPKPGKRVLIERIPFVWKRLNFTQKATVRNMFRYKKRLLMTIIGVAGCMGLVLVGLGLHDSIMMVADMQFKDITHYQATVTIDSTLDGDGRDELSQQITSIEEGVDALVMYQQTVDVQGEGSMQTLTLCVPSSTENLSEYFTFRTRVGKEGLNISDGALISEKTATSLGVSAGDVLTFREGVLSGCTVTVSGIFENYIGHYIFMTKAEYSRISGGYSPAYNQVLLRYPDDSDEFQGTFGNEVLALDGVDGIGFVSTTVKWADDTLSSLNTIVLIVLASASLLAFVVLYNLNSINIAERQRELATLKVLGFYDSEVAAYVFRENIFLTILGVILGIFVGIILHQYVIMSIEVDMIMFGRSIAWPSYIYGSLITLGFSLLVNLVMYRSIKKIEMLKSLQSME